MKNNRSRSVLFRVMLPSFVLFSGLSLHALPTVSVQGLTLNFSESSSSAASVKFVSTESAPVGGLTINYKLSGEAQKDHADNGAPDYTISPAPGGNAGTGSVVIPAGLSEATISFTRVQDTLIEGTESLIVTLNSDAAYIRGDVYKAELRLADDEAEPTVNTGTLGGWIVQQTGRLLEAYNECSGAAASRNYPGVVWFHRDGHVDGGREKLYAFQTSDPTDNSTVIKTLNVTAPSGWSGTWENKQWEDMTIDPEVPGVLWIGDIGANNEDRTDIVFLKITEPDPYGSATSVQPTAYYARYPGGVMGNAECIFMFEGYMHVLLKESGNPRLYRCPSTTISTSKTSPTIMEYVGAVLGGATKQSVSTFSFDRKRMLLSDHARMFVYVSQSTLDPVANTLSAADAKTYIQDLLCTRNPAWALRHNGGQQNPQTKAGSSEGGCFIGDSYDILLIAESREIINLPAWWYEGQPFPLDSTPSLVNGLPKVEIFKPLDATTVSKATGTLSLRTFAHDPDGSIASVNFYKYFDELKLLGPALINANGYYERSWSISNIPLGDYDITAEVTDNQGGVSNHIIHFTLVP